MMLAPRRPDDFVASREGAVALYNAGRNILQRGWTLALDGTNLFDRDPPYVNIIGGFDPGASSILGRVLGINIVEKW